MAGTGTIHLRPPGEAVLRMEDLVVEFPVGNTGQVVHAVSGISIDVLERETLGLVGESGCGKSTTGKAALQSPRPTSGSVQFEGVELTDLGGEEIRRVRPRLQMIFQDPISALNPRRSIRNIVAEPVDIWWSESFPRGPVSRSFAVFRRAAARWLKLAWKVSKYGVPVAGIALATWVFSEAVEETSWEDPFAFVQTVAAVAGIAAAVLLAPLALVLLVSLLIWIALVVVLPFASLPRFVRMRRDRKRHEAETTQRVVEVLEAVGIDAESSLDRKPHEFSGGQAQRISIARALMLDPKVIICDEPVSALDVSVQAQILNLLEDMKDRYGLTLVFIAHDLAVVKNVSDRVAVMYLGKICEVGDPDRLYLNPRHPYTSALLSSVPVPDPDIRTARAPGMEGELPSPIDPPSGCRFRTRCPRAAEVCAEEEPLMADLGGGQYVACHFPLELGEHAALPETDAEAFAPAGGA